MEKKQSVNGKSTKSLILEAAFSFYQKTMTKDFSMNELAQKVGLSKPAIYRHFKNKADVLEAMKTYFFDLIASKLTGYNGREKDFSAEELGKQILKAITVFFVENPQFINYFIYQVTFDPDFLLVMQRALLERGVFKEVDFFREADDDVYFFAHDYFFGISILFFIKLREQQINEGKTVKNADYFAERLYNFLIGGLRGKSESGDFFYPVKIQEGRIKELDSLCTVKPEYLPEENKIFTALAKVIRKYTVNGVTIERIAGELGMAKSSLYFYFENKNQMILSLVQKELSFLAILCRENSVEAKNLSEYIYISMMTEINFFLKRTSILTICGWLIQTSADDQARSRDEDPDSNPLWDKHLEKILGRIDLGFEISSSIIRFWIGILPVAISILKLQNGFTDEKIIKAVKYIFGFVEDGISVSKPNEK